jgi:integrase
VASYRKRGRVWYYTFIDHVGRKIERKGCADKRETEGMARAAEVRSAKIRNGEISVREANLPRQERRPIAEHIEAFEAMLKAKRSTPKHIHMTTRFIREIARLAGAETAAELTAESVTAALLTLQAPRPAKDGEGEVSMSARTVNSYLRGVKSLTRWMARPEIGRLREDPLSGIAMLNEELDRRRVRRPLTPDEAARLIEVTECGPIIMGMSGPDRALLYGVMLATGLRKSEAGSLRPESFALGSDPPAVTIEASYSKRRRRDTLPMPASLAARLRCWVDGKPEGEAVFRLPD